MNTYAELVSAVTAFMGQEGNPEVVNQVPLFIALGEATIYRQLRDERMITNTLVGTTPPYILPDDFLEPQAVWIGYSKISYVPPDMILQDEVSTDTATLWSVLGTELLFNGATTDTTTLSYFAKPAPLVEEVNNLFLLNPDLFLYAALSEAMIFVRDESRSGVWKGLFAEKLAAVRSAAWDARLPRAQPLNSYQLR